MFRSSVADDAVLQEYDTVSESEVSLMFHPSEHYGSTSRRKEDSHYLLRERRIQ